MCAGGADIEWKLIYVGSAEDEKYDQVLDSVLVGPITPGQYRFVFQVGQQKPN
jgi:histone chaperone ASF1